MANSVIKNPNQTVLDLDTVTCSTEDAITNALSDMIMPSGFKGIHLKVLNVNSGGLSLSGGQWTVLMAQILPTYCIFIAAIYDATGCVIRGRSMNGGTFTSWKTIA